MSVFTPQALYSLLFVCTYRSSKTYCLPRTPISKRLQHCGQCLPRSRCGGWEGAMLPDRKPCNVYPSGPRLSLRQNHTRPRTRNSCGLLHL
ncbi:hypothetical protein FKM82_030758 [Ascaphus truei]